MFSVAPEPPTAVEAGIGEDHFNVTWIPGKFNPENNKPLGTDHYVEYRPIGERLLDRLIRALEKPLRA